jgi:cell division protease FtsH
VLTPSEAAAANGSANGHGATAAGQNGNGVGLVKGGSTAVGDVGAPVQR